MAEYITLDSGLIVPSGCAPEPRPTCMDLFCGAGGFSLGMESGGFDVLAACDNDATAAITYLVNLGAHPCQFYWLDDTAERRMERALSREMDRYKKGEIAIPPVSGSNRHRVSGAGAGCRHFFFGDIRNLRGVDVLRALGMGQGELDCVVGGPPCQGFSAAGRRDVMDPRNSLVFEFARLVVELQPKTMVMENVPAIASMVTPEGVNVIEAFCLALEKGGWGTLEALKRSLGVEGRRGAVRGRPPKGDDPRAAAQQELFGG